MHNLICSKAVPEVIRESGGIPVRTRVGHSFIKQVMAETGAIFGGEHSGALLLPRQLPGRLRDHRRARGARAALAGRRPAVGARAAVRALRGVGRDQPAGRRSRARSIERVAGRVLRRGRQDRLDGLTVDLGDWWFNLRPSNTEPLLRLNLEAADAAACEARTAEVLALVGGTA